MTRQYIRRSPKQSAEEATVMEDPIRSELRAPLRNDAMRSDSLERAAKRAAELMDNIGDLDEGTDKFYVDDGSVPEGWTYEWKRFTVINKEDPTYWTQVQRTGWETVPVSRHPEMMPTGWKGEVIEREGLVLMERPAAITAKVREIERRRATEQVRAKEEQISGAPPGTFERVDGNKRPNVKLKRSYQPVEIPAD